MALKLHSCCEKKTVGNTLKFDEISDLFSFLWLIINILPTTTIFLQFKLASFEQFRSSKTREKDLKRRSIFLFLQLLKIFLLVFLLSTIRSNRTFDIESAVANALKETSLTNCLEIENSKVFFFSIDRSTSIFSLRFGLENRSN